MLTLDGSLGEGGGQILRTALALSLCTDTPFCISNIRAGRKKPGLMRQHLTAVRAAAEVGCARVEGDSIGSSEVTFTPGRVTAGDYIFSVGTAGSTMLVLQTLLPPLLQVAGESTLTLQGGTHNPFAPPFDFLSLSFLPLLRRMGASVEAELIRPGFYPAGGGEVRVRIRPCAQLGPLELLQRGEIHTRRARALVSEIDPSVGKRELKVVERSLAFAPSELELVEVTDSPGPGNILTIELASDTVTEVFTGFGERKRRAETVAEMAVAEARSYLAADVPVGKRLADQLLIPMALSGGGSFRTLPLSQHARSNGEIVAAFLPVEIEVFDGADDCCVVLGPRA